jgi:hypothetical protein
VTQATGVAERAGSLALTEAVHSRHRITVGADRIDETPV